MSPRLWIGGSKAEPPPDNSETCSRCRGTGTVHVVPAKSKEHGGVDPYDEDCQDCGGTGTVTDAV